MHVEFKTKVKIKIINVTKLICSNFVTCYMLYVT